MAPPSPTPQSETPRSVRLLHAIAALLRESGDESANELALCEELGWHLIDLVPVISRGVEAGYLNDPQGGGIVLTAKGRAWVETHPEQR